MAARLALASLSAVSLAVLASLAACSPEARRVRDGGPGADPGNEAWVSWPRVNPQAADTTLWPGRAPTPVELLARGEMPPPAQLSASAAPVRNAPVTPNVPLPAREQQTFNRSRSANPRKPSSPPHP